MVSFLVAALGWEPAPPQDLRLLKAPVHGRRETGERGGGVQRSGPAQAPRQCPPTLGETPQIGHPHSRPPAGG